MKNLLLLLLVACMIMSCQKEDSLIEEDLASGSLKSTTVTTEAQLKTAVANASAGDVIKVSGTIYLTSQLQLLTSGSSSSAITITGTSPSNLGVIDCSGVDGWGIKCNGSYWNIKYLDVRYAGDCGFVCQKGGHNYFYWCRFYGNGDSGLQIYNGSYSNSINYCWSWDNYDEGDGGENADGFACKLSAGSGNTYNHCEACHNSDDGWDLYAQPYTVKMNYCTAMYNGYGTDGDGNGFKLGSSGQYVSHNVYYCTSNYNTGSGFDGNGNTAPMNTTGSTATGNGKYDWYRVY